MTVSSGFQHTCSVNFLGKTRQQDFPEYTPLQKCHTTQDIFNPRTYISTQENSALQPNIFIINKKWGFEMTNYSTLVIECAGAHQHKSGLSLIVKKGYCRCQQKRIHYSLIILWNLKYPHNELFSNWRGYCKPWWQNFQDRRLPKGHKILAWRLLRQKGPTLPMPAIMVLYVTAFWIDEDLNIITSTKYFLLILILTLTSLGCFPDVKWYNKRRSFIIYLQQFPNKTNLFYERK